MDLDARAAQRLFQAVVTQALVDAVAVVPTQRRRASLAVPRKVGETSANYAKRRRKVVINRICHAKNDYRRAIRLREDARRWLTLHSRDFSNITYLAGYNPDDIRERATKLAAAGWPQHRLPKSAAVEYDLAA